MIHPMLVVLAVLVILGIGFTITYLCFHQHTRSVERHHESGQYDKAIKVAEGKNYSVRYQQYGNANNGSVFLTIIGPKSHNVKAATADLPARIRVEIEAEDMDEMAIAWIKYRKLAGAVGGPVGNELGSPENPWT